MTLYMSTGIFARHAGMRLFQDGAMFGQDTDMNILGWQSPNRLQELSSNRGPLSPKFTIPLRAAVVAAAANYVGEIIQAARIKPFFYKRGRRSMPVLYAAVAPPDAISPAATLVVRAAMRRMQRPRGRRMLDFDAQDVAVTRTARRAPRTVQRRAGRRWDTPLTQVIVTVTQWPPSITTRRRVVAALSRRGHRWDIPWPQLIQPGSWPPVQIARKRIMTALTRRGRVAALPVAQGGGSGVTSPRRLRTPSPRRSRRFEATPVQTSAVGFSARRTRWTPPRRGRRSDLVWAQVVAAVSQWLPPHIVRRQRYGFAKRGRQFTPPWTGATLNAFIWLPKQLPRRLRVLGLLPRRGRRADAPITQAAPIAPTWVPPTRRRSLRFALRGKVRRAEVTTLQAQPVRKASPTRVYARKTSRGRRWDVIRTTVFVPIGAWLPRPLSSRRVYGLLKRGRRPFTVIRNIRVFAQIATGRIARGERGQPEEGETGDIAEGSEGDILS